MVNKDKKIRVIAPSVRLIACLLLHRNFGFNDLYQKLSHLLSNTNVIL